MPKRDDINSVFVIGAGPIIIGQACEFDYSGTQACRALKEEGIRVVLLNSNPATIMTDPDLADATYVEPVDADTAEKIIVQEKIDAVLPTMGGQTALNCAMDLARRGVFGEGRAVDGKPFLIGAREDSIWTAEDRETFKAAMDDIGLKCAPSAIVGDLQAAMAAVATIGFPLIIRPSFTLGGSGGGIAYNSEEFNELAARGLAESPSGTILLERSLIGWKEFELEVVRDRRDNCIIVCSIENVDPMGVHTGDSITVAPAQTLTDKEYQIMRDAAMTVVRRVGVDTGGANVQFAVNPADGDMVVIEMNPRVSRSSALASKATGFPIAKVATKLAIGYTLDEVANDITGGRTPASFEPSIDYIVTKIPRFDFAKFAPTEDVLTTQMRSVGEVMAIGGTFAESVQKALRGLEVGIAGFSSRLPVADICRLASNETTEEERTAWEDGLRPRLATPHSKRILDVADAFRLRLSVDDVHKLTHIDPWFLAEIETLIQTERDMTQLSEPTKRRQLEEDPTVLQKWKRMGFSDKHIGLFCDRQESDTAGPCGDNYIRTLRETHAIHPVYKRIDTCAGEFPTDTAYLYSTYHGDECELERTEKKKKIIILGSGPNRIGQGIEFDYCCVHGIMALKEAGYETVMVNCNPETVSTDYDTADRLFFEPLTAEDVNEIILKEKPQGVIVQFGGQTPLSIAHELEPALEKVNARIIGTSVESIDLAESRERFQQLLTECELRQPENAIVGLRLARGERPDEASLDQTEQAAMQRAEAIGYPLVIRPSYVLGGRQMEILYSADAMRAYLQKNRNLLSGDVLLDKFLDDATEVDVDAVRDSTGACLIAGVMEHIERAGIHSGDSACSLPPYSLSAERIDEMKRQTRRLAESLSVLGLMNVQFAVHNDNVYVLEVNPRAARTVPFVSKASGWAIAKIAAKAMAGITLSEQNIPDELPASDYYAVKEAVFPFNKFPAVDVLLGPEMKSTGESMGIAADFSAAFLLAQEAILRTPRLGAVIFSVRDEDKPVALRQAQTLAELGYTLTATEGTANYFTENGLPTEKINKVKEGRPHIVDKILSGEAQFVINTVKNTPSSQSDSFSIRRAALLSKVIYFTTMSGTIAMTQGLFSLCRRDWPQKRALQEWHKQQKG